MSGLWSYRGGSGAPASGVSSAGLTTFTDAYYTSEGLGMAHGVPAASTFYDDATTLLDGAWSDVYNAHTTSDWFESLRAKHEGTSLSEARSTLESLRALPDYPLAVDEMCSTNTAWCAEEAMAENPATINPIGPLCGQLSLPHPPTERLKHADCAESRLLPLSTLTPNVIPRREIIPPTRRSRQDSGPTATIHQVASQITQLRLLASKPGVSSKQASSDRQPPLVGFVNPTRGCSAAKTPSQSTIRRCTSSLRGVGQPDSLHTAGLQGRAQMAPEVRGGGPVGRQSVVSTRTSRGTSVSPSTQSAREVHHRTLAQRRLTEACQVTPPCLVPAKAREGQRAAAVALKEYAGLCLSMANQFRQRSLLREGLVRWVRALQRRHGLMARLALIRLKAVWSVWVRFAERRQRCVVAFQRCTSLRDFAARQNVFFGWLYLAHTRLMMRRRGERAFMHRIFTRMLCKTFRRREVRVLVRTEKTSRDECIADCHRQRTLSRQCLRMMLMATEMRQRSRYRETLMARAKALLEEN